MQTWLIDVEWPEAGSDDHHYEVVGVVEAETWEDALSQVKLSARRLVRDEQSVSDRNKRPLGGLTARNANGHAQKVAV